MLLVLDTYQNDNHNLVQGLWISICCIFFVAIFFLGLTFIKRALKIKKERAKQRIESEVEVILFEYMFNATVLPEFNTNSPLFQKVVIKSIKNLHQNYTGIYQERLEHLYVSGGFVNYSLKKTTSKKWIANVEAIRDLSTLNYKKAMPHLEKLIHVKNELVQLEALIGIIRLSGLDRLQMFKNSSIQLNDWAQSNILYAIKKANLKQPSDFETLFDSNNQTFIIFALRLADYFHFPISKKQLDVLKTKIKSPKLLAEIENKLNNLHQNESE